MTYVDFQEVVAQDKTVADRGSDDFVNSHFIYYAEKWVETKLSPGFTVPFDAAHPTVKDLVIKATLCRFERDPELRAACREELQEDITALLSGAEGIMTGSGTLMASTAMTEVSAQGSGYKPTFDMRDYPDQRIDPDLLDDLDDEDA